MRCSLPLRFCAPALRGGGRRFLAVGVALSVGGIVPLAAEASDARLARLGFSFDQRAHDAVQTEIVRDQGQNGAPPVGTVRLPRYIVNGDRVRFRDGEHLTPKEQADRAIKRYLNPVYAKTLGPLIGVASLVHNLIDGWAPNRLEAMTLFENDEQKRRNIELSDLKDLATLNERLTNKPDADSAPAKGSK